MPLSFTIADAETGLGGTCSISGTTGGSTNSLYHSLWEGPTGALAWTLTGSRAGDGDIAISLGTGHYFWQVLRVEGATTEIGHAYYQPLTDVATVAIHNGILDAVRTRILALNLSGMVNTTVLKRWFPRVWENVDATPACAIAPPGKEQMLSMLTNKDDIGYPVVVAFIDKLKQDPILNLNRDLLWRQRVSKAFREQRLPGAPLVFKCNVEPDAIVDPTAFESGYLVSIMVLRFVTRETRGIS